ncbi:MAG: YggS family pyridoxal phosphate-dependent enzyme [Endomicrobium sp.]|jgi:pyridoxal phosphate enzyme (YggS family)|nr:YggS family pyridoxal phosphate-dependent enzyme [Endomicrobium sp.]
MKSICQKIKLVQSTINSIIKHTNNNRNVTLIAITKTFSYQDVLQALMCGIKHIGESRIQEALPKFAQLGSSLNGIMKHFIGHIQSNKVKKIVDNFDLIHSLDNVKIANLISKYAKICNKIQQCLIEVKMQKSESRSGLHIKCVKELYQYCLTIPNISIKGLMVIAPYNSSVEELSQCFKKVYKLFHELKIYFVQPEFNVLSMGMSADYKIAIEEGSNMIRIGTAIFG